MIHNRARRAGWRIVGSVRKYYRSKWEANYARYLEWLRVNGKIVSWQHEPDTFWFLAIKRGCRSYLPDFKVTYPNGDVVYHEVKGWMDPRSATKLKRMAKYHPTVRMHVVQRREYVQVALNAARFIPEWEP